MKREPQLFPLSKPHLIKLLQAPVHGRFRYVLNAGVTNLNTDVVGDEYLNMLRNPYDLPIFCREFIPFLKAEI